MAHGARGKSVAGLQLTGQRTTVKKGKISDLEKFSLSPMRERIRVRGQ
jgi:hypothetical protein